MASVALTCPQKGAGAAVKETWAPEEAGALLTFTREKNGKEERLM